MFHVLEKKTLVPHYLFIHNQQMFFLNDYLVADRALARAITR